MTVASQSPASRPAFFDYPLKAAFGCVLPKGKVYAFGKAKHIFFIAETKGSMSTLDLREIEDCKIRCARKFFARISCEQVKYDVVDNYAKLMELVK